MAVLHARVRQTMICRPVYREAFRIVDMPVEGVEVVLVKDSQEFKDGLDRKELPACV
jgi:hypothetical protein